MHYEVICQSINNVDCDRKFIAKLQQIGKIIFNTTTITPNRTYRTFGIFPTFQA